MNLPNSVDDETTNPEFQRRRERSFLTVDGQAWDVSNLLDSLPPFPDNERRNMYSREHSLLKQDIFDGKPNLNPSVKKTSLSHSETNIRLRPVPKYEWRSSSPSQKQGPQQVHHDDGEYPDDDDDGTSVVLHEPSAEADNGVNPSDDFERSIIEIFPGVEMPLRGSLETQQAISRNYVIGVNCMDCTLRLKCIRNAEYVLCPLCHCVSPLELSCSNLEVGSFGVGLGFVEEMTDRNFP